MIDKEIVRVLKLTPSKFETGEMLINDCEAMLYKTIAGAEILIMDCDLYGQKLTDQLLFLMKGEKKWCCVRFSKEMLLDTEFTETMIDTCLIKKYNRIVA